MLAIAAAVLLVLEILLQIGRYKDPQWLPIAVVAVVATGTLTHHEPDGSISRCD